MVCGFLGYIIGALSTFSSFLRNIVGSASAAALAYGIKLRIPLFEDIPVGLITLFVSIFFLGSKEELKVA